MGCSLSSDRPSSAEARGKYPGRVYVPTDADPGEKAEAAAERLLRSHRSGTTPTAQTSHRTSTEAGSRSAAVPLAMEVLLFGPAVLEQRSAAESPAAAGGLPSSAIDDWIDGTLVDDASAACPFPPSDGDTSSPFVVDEAPCVATPGMRASVPNNGASVAETARRPCVSHRCNGPSA
jgi:hypothetical protein